ncbi:hypothetical protein ACU635_50950 [[Actinomadura] parvosata]|uniref:hypothetical protein n=1 Tax=[Actinomadura] parvosata TaxID=1955412 RepID=UPI00406C4725
MSGLTMARLRQMASAASGRQRRLTIVSGPDGRRWAAWPYGAIELTDQHHGWLDRPLDGCYRMRTDGLARLECELSFGPALVQSEMLPILTATNRTAVVPTRWFYEDGLVVRRLLERSDGQHVVVDADMWRAWNVPVGGPVWQLGSRHGALVWASTATAPGVALLLPVRAEVVPVPPEVAEGVT